MTSFSNTRRCKSVFIGFRSSRALRWMDNPLLREVTFRPVHFLLSSGSNQNIGRLTLASRGFKQCVQMRQFYTIWAISVTLGHFFVEIYLLLGVFWEKLYLLVAIFYQSLFTVGRLFVDNWALFHSNHLVTLPDYFSFHALEPSVVRW